MQNVLDNKHLHNKHRLFKMNSWFGPGVNNTVDQHN
jgi:hypothetical protein